MSFQKRCSDELTNDPGMLTTVVSNKHLNEKQTTNRDCVNWRGTVENFWHKRHKDLQL